MASLDVLTAYPPPLRVDEGGAIREGNSRGTLDTVLAAHRNGYAPKTIVRKYPSLSLEAVYAFITYYLWYREEVETYLAQRQQEVGLSEGSGAEVLEWAAQNGGTVFTHAVHTLLAAAYNRVVSGLPMPGVFAAP